MKKENLANLGTIFASFLAASCCVGPAIFIVFGTSVGFLGWFAVFEPYRPYFLIAAGLMLAYSFHKLYMRPSGCDCREDKRVRRAARIVFWIGVFFFLVALFFQKFLLWYYE
ncbi:MAG: mercuric transport protein MerT [Desulfobulbaceae bacterium]